MVSCVAVLFDTVAFCFVTVRLVVCFWYSLVWWARLLTSNLYLLLVTLFANENMVD